jgi:membrane-associated phospholipid phosphatase
VSVKAIPIPEPRASLLRKSEYLVAGYFLLSAVRATMHRRALGAAVDVAVPLVFCGLAWVERRGATAWVAILRDWLIPPVLLVAYWNVDWSGAAPHWLGWEYRWIELDRLLLDRFGGRAVIESCGSLWPAVLELLYLGLYALPPILLGVVYLSGRRARADDFLATMLAGALAAYALLPLFPTRSPGEVFPGQDLPSVTTLFRQANVWLLGNFDIHTSIFPSGHVAVAFSAAFGMMRVFPERRGLGRLLIVYATLVAVNTVYARYHYAVDGLAGFAISLAVNRVCPPRLDSTRT